MTSASWLLTRRTLIQFPRNPMMLGFSVAPLLMIVMGTLLGIVTFGAISANLAIRTRDAAAVQAIQPMAFLLIFLTTAYQTEEQVPSGVLRAVMAANPTEYVLRAMRDLTLTGFDWQSIGLAFAVIAGLALIGLPLTVRNYRSVYR